MSSCCCAISLLEQVKYTVKPKQAISEHSPDSVLATYGFMPADVVMRAPSPAAPAFWPEVLLPQPIKCPQPCIKESNLLLLHKTVGLASSEGCWKHPLTFTDAAPSSVVNQALRSMQTAASGKGPHVNAATEALRAAAAAKKPPGRVLFCAAAKVDAPERPEAALRQRQHAALSRRRIRGTADNLSIEVSTRSCLLCVHAGCRQNAGAVYARQGHTSAHLPSSWHAPFDEQRCVLPKPMCLQTTSELIALSIMPRQHLNDYMTASRINFRGVACGWRTCRSGCGGCA